MSDQLTSCAEDKHTPGPWTWDPDAPSGAIVGPEGQVVMYVNWEEALCVTRPGDAQLILAAPDLLAACELARRALNCSGPERLLDPEEETARDALWTAINKATGVDAG